MRKFLKLIGLLMTFIMLLGLMVACGNNSETGVGEKKVQREYMTFGGPPSSSSLYPYWVAVGKCVEAEDNSMSITVSDSQGAIDITKRVRTGDFDVGNSMSSADYENYYGLGVFNDDPYKDVRILWYFDATPIQLITSKDSNITNINELEGVKFNPGGTGTSVAVLVKQICEALEVTPEYFEAGQADAGDAVANNQIVGTAKAGPAPDSFVMQIEAKKDINIISFTDDQIANVIKKYPYLVPVTVPAGAYSSVDYEFKTFQVLMGAQTTIDITQEQGYNMVKAVFETQKELWQSAYQKGKNNDLIELTLNSKVPLHAGTIQYLKEIGVDVPDELIPDEYVE